MENTKMQNKTEKLKTLCAEAAKSGKILESSAENIGAWLSKNFLPEWALDALLELFESGEYEELNDRFFKPLTFGTGGMRGRTIGKKSPKSELGKSPRPARPSTPPSGRTI
ncbi:MAG: hypothetical protein IJI37_04070 [Opitutales bacterium]|nr:hypothetical protein [Opitutales bacterium]